MSAYDELDAEPEPDVDDAAPLGELPVDVFVCDHTDADGICGASFDNQRSLNMHALGKHRDKSKDSPRGEGPKAKRKPAPRARSSKDSAPRKAAAKVTPEPAGGRSATYASSIAMAALGAYLVVPPFDTYDLDIVNRGAPNLADALASAGEQNQTIRSTCDLILGGGAGGAYIQLLLALSAIVVPICAHHGVVPASAGARFGEMIGAQPPAAPAASPSPPAGDTTTGTSGPPDWSTMTGEQILDHFAGLDQTVLFGLAGKMMGMMQPDVVDIGGTYVGDGPQGEPMPKTWAQREADAGVNEEQVDVERGSEQLAPDSVAVPT